MGEENVEREQKRKDEDTEIGDVKWKSVLWHNLSRLLWRTR